MMANVVQICMVAKMNSQWLPISTAKFASHLQLLRIKCESIFSSREYGYKSLQLLQIHLVFPWDLEDLLVHVHLEFLAHLLECSIGTQWVTDYLDIFTDICALLTYNQSIPEPQAAKFIVLSFNFMQTRAQWQQCICGITKEATNQWYVVKAINRSSEICLRNIWKECCAVWLSQHRIIA